MYKPTYKKIFLRKATEELLLFIILCNIFTYVLKFN